MFSPRTIRRTRRISWALLLVPWIILLLVPSDALAAAVFGLVLSSAGWITVLFGLKKFEASMAKVEELNLLLGESDDQNGIEGVTKKIQGFKNAISVELGAEAIDSRIRLSESLGKLVGISYTTLNAQAIELSLYNEEVSAFHSAYMMGIPKNIGSLGSSGVTEDPEEGPPVDMIEHYIRFAGEELGALRVYLKGGRAPSRYEREITNLFGLQAGISVINSRYAQELISMRNESDATIKMKTGFLANLSHEIRGPLGIILNATEITLDGLCGALTEEQSDTLNMVKVNTSHLLDLINDVLDYAKIESGKMTPRPVTISVKELLPEMIAMVRVQAESKKHKLELKDLTEDLFIFCDRRHIRQSLINLLTNAIKYTPPEGWIEVAAERLPNDRIRIWVRDNGVGISEGERHKVFSEFERIQSGYSATQAGTGLGMPLTKRLIEINQGAIDFNSWPDKGTEFWINLPAGDAKHEETKISKDEAKISTNAKGQFVALLGTDVEERGMLTRYLKHTGFLVAEGDSWGAVCEAACKSPTCIVILTDQLLNKFGKGIIREVRSTAPEKLGIVILSNDGFIADAEQGIRMGADRFVARPVKLTELATLCGELFDSFKRDENLKGKI